MNSVDGTREQVQKLLEPYVLPREEVAYRRRILAAHIKSSTRDDHLPSPLGLAQSSGTATIPVETRGLHEAYLKALNANISARAEYDKVQSEISKRPRSALAAEGGQTASGIAVPGPLEEHLVKIKLQRKQDRLRVVDDHIGIINKKPAASTNYLDSEEIFSDTRPLPEVPREVVEALAEGEIAGRADLGNLIDRLEKQALRARLLLTSEEKLLDTIRSRSVVRPETIDDRAKLHALNVTRTELINWMEAELGKVPAEDEDQPDDGIGPGSTQTPVDISQLDEQMWNIKNKYSQYLSARRTLLQLVSQQVRPPVLQQPDLSAKDQVPNDPPVTRPGTYLLTPYLERLLSLTREQKALITQKSHLNTTIARQLKNTTQLLDHLSAESNLVPSHPLPGGARRKPGFGDAGPLGATSETLCSVQIKPWVYAADSAKIATLEAVAEKIEEGQVALEGSMSVIREMERVLGKMGTGDMGQTKDDATEDSDIWLAEEKSSKAEPGRKIARKETRARDDTDLWAFLDGTLGLLKGGEE